MDHRTFCARLAVALSIAAGAAAHAGFIDVHGGPNFTPGSGGYLSPMLPYGPGATAGNGVGTGNATYIDPAGLSRGTRAVRWDAAGNADALDHDGDLESTAFAVNASGAIVGSAQDASVAGIPSRAVVWKPGQPTRTTLGNINTSAVGNSSAIAINDVGAIAGYAERFDDDGTPRGTRAVRWSATGSATALEPIDPDAAGNAMAAGYAINHAGTVVGVGSKLDGTERAVRWSASGAATELGVINTDSTGSTFSGAIAINTAGTAAGYAYRFADDGEGYRGRRAVRWDANEIAATELGTLGTDADGNGDATSAAINDAGTIVGSSNLFVNGNDLGFRAARWDAGSIEAEPLGGLGGVTIASEAYGINAGGDAVGYIDFENLSGNDRQRRASLWNDDGDALDLNALIDPASGWTLLTAYGINDAGWITGIGSFDPDGSGLAQPYERLFLIQLPEPTTGSAVVAEMLVMLRRRARA